MKKTLFIIALFLLIGTVNAQWYNSYGVTNINDLTAEQCQTSFEKAVKTTKTGATLTVIGVIAGAAGYLISMNAITDMDYTDPDMDGFTGGSMLMYGGIIVGSIGIPLWISGSTRKSQIEVAMVKFKDTSGLGFKITF